FVERRAELRHLLGRPELGIILFREIEEEWVFALAEDLLPETVTRDEEVDCRNIEESKSLSDGHERAHDDAFGLVAPTVPVKRLQECNEHLDVELFLVRALVLRND